jgi:photosystem II stability/assembly factor-like uncharacterized protein
MRFAFASVLFVSVASAQVPDALFQSMEWRMIGPFRGGRSVAATGIAGNPNTFLFGAVGGGIWKSTDAGAVWTPIFDEQNVASIGALEVAPSNPNVLYAGTGEADIRSDLASGNGVYKSVDGGAHWKNIGLNDTRQIGRIVIHPKNPDIVFVAALGHAYGPNEQRGVYRSTDGGATWSHVLDKGPDIGAVDLTIDPDHPDTIYAATWQARRTTWSQYAPEQGPGSSIYRSTDGGSTWTELGGGGLPAAPGMRRIGIAVARGTNGQRIYALIDHPKEAGLYRSDDGAKTWTRVSADPRITSRAWYFSFIAVDPNHPDQVYIPNVALFRSTDGGRNFTVLRGAPGGDDYHSIWIDPTDSNRMIIGTDQGVSISLNNGATWTPWYNQPTAQMYHVITDNQFPYNVCGCQQDSGALCVPSRTDHFSITERDFKTIGGNEAGYVAPDPKDDNTLYLTDTYGVVTRYDRRTAQAQEITPWPVPSFGLPANRKKYRAPWTTVLVFSHAEADSPESALYLGTQFLLKTTDGGLNWKQISPDLTGPDGRGVLFSIAPSPLFGSLLWTGSDTGLVHLTRNGGRTWEDVTPHGLTAWSKITQLEASHFDAGEAWAAVDRHRLEDYEPHLYRTRDYGKTWTEITAGIAHGAFLNSVREDPKRRGLLYAATETGVYVSVDDGDHWQSLQLNLPAVSVRDLVVKGDDLVIATHGRSFWILDDVTPLRQTAGLAANSAPRLFEPADAVRMFNAWFLGTPLPPEVPAGKNPPSGAMIDYWLPAGYDGRVAIEILDAKGQLVRRYASTDAVPPAPKNTAVADRWFETEAPPGSKPGLNRFVWDMRYAGPAAEPGAPDQEIGPVRGPLVVPGDYTVRFTALGKMSYQLMQRLHVFQDPRAPVEQSVLEEQRDLALRIVSSLTDAQKLGERLKGPADEAQREKLGHVQVELSSALSAVTSADRKAPAQALEVVEEAMKELGQLKAAASR